VWGYFSGKSACQTQADLTTAKTETLQVQSNLSAVQTQAQKSNDAGTSLANTEQAVRVRTQTLIKEAVKNEKVNPVSSDCRIDPERLRLWNAANTASVVDTAPTTAAERSVTVP
jgi:hypothetical protein